jgi:hypothetical protein
VHRLEVRSTPLVAKRASGAARRRLRREAELLGHLEDLPVVRLIAIRESDDCTDLVTADGGADLSIVGGRDPDALLRTLASAASAIGALHVAGWTHGAICAEHLVADPEGDVVLCSLGSAHPVGDEREGMEHDVAQLRTVIDRLLGRADPCWSTAQRRRWRQVGRRYAGRLRSADAAGDDGRPVSATELADLLGCLVDDRGRASRHGRPQHRSRPRMQLAGASTALVIGAVATGVTALLWGAMGTAGSTSTAMPEPSPARPTDAGARLRCDESDATAVMDVDADGCPDRVVVEGNELRAAGTTVRAGRDGDQVVVATMGCREDAHVVLLRPATGEVFVFEEWPSTDRPSSARIVTVTRPGAALGVADRGSCRTAVVTHADGTAEPLPAVTPPTTRVAMTSEDRRPPAPAPTEEDENP